VKFTTPFGEYEINLPTDTTVGIKLSGGADSAIVTYMLALYRKQENPSLKFHFVTTAHYEKAYQIIKAKDVIAFIDQEVGLGDYQHTTNMCSAGEDYITRQQDLFYPLVDEGLVDCVFSGITANPPMTVMLAAQAAGELPGMSIIDARAPERDAELTRPIGRNWLDARGHYQYNTLLHNTDKRGVAALYSELGVIDTLFPVTRSCEEKTTDFTRHCGECWWCWERQYGFGRLT
jgi:hypothetical protein